MDPFQGRKRSAMESNLSILETKVLEAVGLIKDLRAENEGLKRKCDDLAAGLAEAEDAKGKLNHELDQVRQEARQVEDFEEKRKEIEDKVGGLLQQLEALG